MGFSHEKRRTRGLPDGLNAPAAHAMHGIRWTRGTRHARKAAENAPLTRRSATGENDTPGTRGALTGAFSASFRGLRKARHAGTPGCRRLDALNAPGSGCPDQPGLRTPEHGCAPRWTGRSRRFTARPKPAERSGAGAGAARRESTRLPGAG